ncbi:MAG TPA: hypothetical protein VGP72_19595 [Planctomycetota bacterium]|jgi:hypothetical protein
MLVRFCMLWPDADSRSPQGILQAAIRLRDAGELESYEAEWLEQELSWLRLHLPSPECLNERGNDRAICWFKPQAKTAIDKARGIVALLESRGLHVKMMTTADPGSIVYQDKWQVVAKPRRQPAPSDFQKRRFR